MVIAPKMPFPHLARLYQGMAFVTQDGMICAADTPLFAPYFPSMAQQYCHTCAIAQAYNIGSGIKTNTAAHPALWGPFVHVQIIQMPDVVPMFMSWC